VVRAFPLLLVLSACTLQEGTVLIARGLDAASADGEAASDEGAALLDAAADADTSELPEAGPVARGVCRIGGAADGLYDSFDGNALAAKSWLVAQGPVQFAGQRAQGGFARENVRVEGGALVLAVRGDRYAGPVRGVDASGKPLSHGRRSAAAVATLDLFASATYQVQGRFTGPPGLELALWFVRDDDSSGAIDLATPGTDTGQPSYAHVRMRSRDAAAASELQFALSAPFDDQASHILRFDWYTTAASAVSFWVDDRRRWETDQRLPSQRAGRLWIVAWVPDQAPADFDTAEVRIENAFVTPFGNDGDRCTDGELSGPFLTEP
jgi:hypothetical protein